ncbi:Hypothetical protein SMAX5B_005172 [Scophthalmus maximus]|uniref:Uncharacterized protein n=1 Tax=Scophthalmus maximus TaxID=52904 RepID=A0A2U9BFD0_SCOMX|nr:Hypothetical protein SMAX5B_005172 [Scophthalmus maximus]
MSVKDFDFTLLLLSYISLTEPLVKVLQSKTRLGSTTPSDLRATGTDEKLNAIEENLCPNVNFSAVAMRNLE